MRIWQPKASWRGVASWYRTVGNRASANATRNEDLTDAQRELLKTEAATARDVAAKVRDKGRAQEDFEDGALSGARDESYVTDFLCDSTESEVHATLGTKRALLASAGTTRDEVMGAKLTPIKQASRPDTVKYARDVTRELRQLPAFPERDPLAQKLERRGNAHEETTKTVGTLEAQAETEHTSPLASYLAQLRVAAVKLNARLEAALPMDLVESLYPETRPSKKTGPKGGGTGGSGPV